MTTIASEHNPAVEAPTPPVGREHDLGTVESPHAPSEVLSRLLALAKRGKLAGYQAGTGDASASVGTTFRASIFGEPYDRELIGAVEPKAGGGSIIRLRSRLLRKLPAIMIAVFILTVQPGLWLTDSMLKVYFSWYRIETWWWYLPLVLLSAPVMWKQFKKSERTAAAEAALVVQAIRQASA